MDNNNEGASVSHPETADTVAPGLKYHRVLLPAVDLPLMSHW